MQALRRLQRNDVLEMSEESYDRVMNINLKGPVFFAQKIAKEMIWMKEQISTYRPVIIFITSVSAVLTSTNRAEYCISKAGLSMASTGLCRQTFKRRYSRVRCSSGNYPDGYDCQTQRQIRQTDI